MATFQHRLTPTDLSRQRENNELLDKTRPLLSQPDGLKESGCVELAHLILQVSRIGLYGLDVLLDDAMARHKKIVGLKWIESRRTGGGVD